MGNHTEEWTVVCGHCTCRAGLAEICSHIADILYWLETAICICINNTCTNKPNNWASSIFTKACQQVLCVSLEEMEKNFPAANKHCGRSNQGQNWPKVAKQITSKEDIDGFYKILSNDTKRKPGILTLVPLYSANHQTTYHPYCKAGIPLKTFT